MDHAKLQMQCNACSPPCSHVTYRQRSLVRPAYAGTLRLLCVLRSLRSCVRRVYLQLCASVENFRVKVCWTCFRVVGFVGCRVVVRTENIVKCCIV